MATTYNRGINDIIVQSYTLAKGMTDRRPQEEMSTTTMGRRQDVGENAGAAEPDKKKRKLGVSL